MNEVMDAVSGLTDAFAEFRARYDGKLAALQNEVEQTTLRLDRPGVTVSSKTGGDLVGERRALGAFVKAGSEVELKSVGIMETGVDPAGGWLTLPAVSNSMTRRLWDASPVRRLARVQQITSGDAWVEPIDRDESAAQWVGELQARPALASPQLGMLSIPLNEIFSSQQVSQKLLDLSYTDIGAWLEGKIADKFARSEGEAFLTGNGVGKPMGILSYPIVSTADASRAADRIMYVATGSGTDVTADSLRSIYWSLRAGYRQNATWLMSSATASVIDKLKATADGTYLWRDAMSSSEPPSLLGRPVAIDENCPAIGGNSYPILFGDFQRAYVIVERNGLKLLRDPYTAKPSVVFYAYRRVGGGLGDCDAIRVLKVATS